MPFNGLTPFLRWWRRSQRWRDMDVSMPFNGLTPFLRSPLGTPWNRAFADSILQVIVWQFQNLLIICYFCVSLHFVHTYSSFLDHNCKNGFHEFILTLFLQKVYVFCNLIINSIKKINSLSFQNNITILFKKSNKITNQAG